jgi:hypothetical protein
MRKRKKVEKWPYLGARNQNWSRNDPNVQDQRTRGLIRARPHPKNKRLAELN